MRRESILPVTIILAVALFVSGVSSCSSVRSRLGLGGDGDGKTAESGSLTQSGSQSKAVPAKQVFPAEKDQRMVADSALRQAITQKSAKVPAKERTRVEKSFSEAARRVDNEVKLKGDAAVADRLAAQFRLSPESLLDEKITYDVSWHDEKRTYDATWGEIMIAHTLADRSKVDVTAKQLLDLRRNEYAWWKIAAGLELDLAQATDATASNADLALGR